MFPFKCLDIKGQTMTSSKGQTMTSSKDQAIMTVFIIFIQIGKTFKYAFLVYNNLLNLQNLRTD